MNISYENILSTEIDEGLSEKEFYHLLRFADILSSSQNEMARNLAYKIVSLIFEYHKSPQIIENILKVILVKLGNFPAIKFFEKTRSNAEFQIPTENQYEETIKRSIQAVPNSELVFTDSQYNIFELLKKNQHFSFSGPTSLGKSFIIESFIKYLIIEEKIKDNIAILVPTRALINQNLLKLKENFKEINNFEILVHPKIPQYIKNKGNNYIFIFTPERLISYISDKNNPSIEYLFIDEAHKVISEKDTRSPLYYHAILQAQKKSMKLYFASPNISNPEIYLKLFDKSTDESFYTIESPVSQNKYFLDLQDQELKIIGEFETSSMHLNNDKGLFEWITSISGTGKSIIYCNSKNKTRDYAIQFSEQLLDKNDEKVNQLIKLIKETIHEEYYLINCLKKGIGFHFGDLPQRIRVQLENLFRNGHLDYLFCTSTLLEGVNLPAKNIFILSEKIGMSNFRKVDFLNLIGRAGRLSKEFSGNIFVVKEKNAKDWNKKSVLEDLFSKEKPPKVKSQVIDGQKKFYENIFLTLGDHELTRKSNTNYEVEILNHYSNIALLHSIERTGSVFLNTLLTEIPDSAKVLENETNSNKVPMDILKVSSSISLEYQNQILKLDSNSLIKLTSNPTTNEILEVLKFMHKYYNWQEEEVGRDQILKLAKNEKQINLLKFYSILIFDWINSKPLKYLISRSINYQHENQLDELPDNFTELWMGNVSKISKDNFHIIVYENWKNIRTIWNEMEKYWKVKNMLVWHLPNRNQGFAAKYKFFSKHDIAMVGSTENKETLNLEPEDELLQNEYESALYATAGKPHWEGYEKGKKIQPTDFIEYKASDEKSSGQGIIFGTKPLEILIPYIKVLTQRDDLIIEPFGGSGSTLIASTKMKRRCYLMEKSPVYAEVIKNRWEKLTGKKGVKIS